MWEVIILLVLIGMAMIVAEIFLPGGLLGLLGATALVGAIAVSFYSNGLMVGSLTAAVIGLGSIVGFLIWLKYFPTSVMGRKLTLATAELPKSGGLTFDHLIGKEGVAVSVLRPSGVALIDGKRIDVTTHGSYIDVQTPVVVDFVEGNRIVVRKKL